MPQPPSWLKSERTIITTYQHLQVTNAPSECANQASKNSEDTKEKDTLCMLRIDSESQSLAVQEVLRNLQRSFVQVLPPSTKLEFTGVGNFHGRLLYAKVAVHHGLSKMVSVLLECLQKAGICTPGNFIEYMPHMTLLKLSRPMQHEAHTAIIVPALYSKFTDMHLGTQKIKELHLCSTSGPKVDGFYETLMTLPCSLVCLPPSILSIISHSQLWEYQIYIYVCNLLAIPYSILKYLASMCKC